MRTLVSPSHHDYADLCQEGWLALHKAAAASERARDRWAYLARAVRNGVIDYLRREQRHAVLLPLEDASDAPDPSQDPEWEAARVELRRIVSQLPELERRVVERRYGFAGSQQTQDEIAEALGVSVRTVRRVEARALRALRAAYGGLK